MTLLNAEECGFLEGMCKEALRNLLRFVAKIGKKSILLLGALLCVWKVIKARELIKAVIFTTAANMVCCFRSRMYAAKDEKRENTK